MVPHPSKNGMNGLNQQISQSSRAAVSDTNIAGLTKNNCYPDNQTKLTSSAANTCDSNNCDNIFNMETPENGVFGLKLCKNTHNRSVLKILPFWII